MSLHCKKIPLSALSSAALVLLSACGGGSGSGSGANAVNTSKTITGIVVDGYIEGAKVCLDANSNGVCDTGEPNALTVSGGHYQLDVTGLSIAGLRLIAEIPASAKDSDDGGLSLQEAGRSAYTMAAPASEPSVITPITTLVMAKAQSEHMNLAAAKALVLEELGLPPDTRSDEDHIATGNAIVHASARQVAAVLQQVQKDLPADTPAGQRPDKLLKALKDRQDDAGSIAAQTQNADTLNMPQTLSGLATGQLLAYKMPSTLGKQINATAMLFTPKSQMPLGGWPLVVFGHGTAGVGQNCAPSVEVHTTGNWGYADLVGMLLGQGWAVVAPDYEGLGSSNMGVVAGHPYLDLRSAGQSMALAAVAAKKLMGAQLSGAWATLGHSQGGHAALAGAQFADLAKKHDGGLKYKGAVAIAPASNLLASINSMASLIQANSSDVANFATGYAVVGTSNLYTAYLIKGNQSTSTQVDASMLFGPRMLSLYQAKAGTESRSEFSTSITKDLNQFALTQGASPASYTGFIQAAINTPAVMHVLAGNEPGQMKLPGSTLLVQGSADTTVLPSSTQALLATMQAKGSQVTMSYHEGSDATHGGVLAIAAARTAVTNHLSHLFGGN